MLGLINCLIPDILREPRPGAGGATGPGGEGGEGGRGGGGRAGQAGGGGQVRGAQEAAGSFESGLAKQHAFRPGVLLSFNHPLPFNGYRLL